MKIVVAGTGFVGLTHAAVLAENGHEVHAYDIDLAKIAAYASLSLIHISEPTRPH